MEASPDLTGAGLGIRITWGPLSVVAFFIFLLFGYNTAVERFEMSGQNGKAGVESCATGPLLPIHYVYLQ